MPETTIRTTVRLPQDALEVVRQQAESEDRSLAYVLRRVLTEAIEGQQQRA